MVMGTSEMSFLCLGPLKAFFLLESVLRLYIQFDYKKVKLVAIVQNFINFVFINGL